MSAYVSTDRKFSGEAVDISLTLAVCSSRIERYWRHVIANKRALRPSDVALCIVDSPLQRSSQLVAELEAAGVQVVVHDRNLGLSASRNRALALCRTRHLLFVDDDATVTRETVGAVRTAFYEGAGVVGVRLQPPIGLPLARWFISYGQYHYLALHRPDRPISAWGACMGVDVWAARRHGLAFRADLGRTGAQLESGDDTAFLRALATAGYQVALLDDVVCTHHVAAERLRLGYLLRRAWWQGRSEVRRRNCAAGLAKELRRNLDVGGAHNVLAVLPGLLYVGAVVIGMVMELFAVRTSRWVVNA